MFRSEPKFQAKYSNVWMRGVFRPDPKFLAIFTNLDAWGFFSQDPISWRYFPGQMRCPFQSEPKFLATFSRLNARRFSVRTKTSGDIPQFKCEVFVGQGRNSWRYLPICLRGVLGSYPKCLAVFSDLNAMCVSARTEILGGFSQFKCEALFRKNQRFWRYFPV